jgi:hypothetical protein
VLRRGRSPRHRGGDHGAGVIKNGCWGGIVRYDAHERKFTVDDTVCNDARFYHLEFSHDLRLISKKERDAD